MGFIHESHGTISIETRRESFIIHAGYGYEPGLFPLRDFAVLGAEFVAESHHWIVTLIAEDRIEAREVTSGVVEAFDPGNVVERPGYEQHAEGSFAALWREPHPEFANEDLQDLIDALVEVADKAG